MNSMCSYRRFIHSSLLYRGANCSFLNATFSFVIRRTVTTMVRNSVSERIPYLKFKHTFCRCMSNASHGDATSFSGVNEYAMRSHTCGELRSTDIGKKVVLCGWVEFIRLNKFILLRDTYGSTQVIFDDVIVVDVLNFIRHRIGSINMSDLSATCNFLQASLTHCFETLTLETTVSITGSVYARPEIQINKNLCTGEIEVRVESIRILCPATRNLPFHIRDYNKAKGKTLNRYRYLALRFPELQRNLRLRSEMIFKMREFLIRNRNFVEVETPTLFKKTPGGAQEFIVPTHFKDKFYSLVQSPQQLKQLLMVGSIDRYFQIARCYRDERTNTERQPEFTQLDIELSFTNAKSVMKLTEDVLAASWPYDKTSLQIPFPKIQYEYAMENFGSDKPCLIDKFLFQNLKAYLPSNLKKHVYVYMFVIPDGKLHHSKLSSQFKDLSAASDVNVFTIKAHNSEKLQQSLTKIISGFDTYKFCCDFLIKSDDLLIVAVGSDKGTTLKMLGLCRHQTIGHLNLIQHLNKNKIYNFYWIVDFPLVELDDSKQLVSTHHPFTQPHPEDVSLIPNDILKVRSLAYDLVLNGSEIGGGSIRIHNAEMQRSIFKLLNLDESYFSHLIEAFQMGCPPHGGIALGLDRLVATLCNCTSIKDVIAFPKSTDGSDFMTKCPDDIPVEDKIRYHINYKKSTM